MRAMFISARCSVVFWIIFSHYYVKGEDIITVARQISVTKPFEEAHFNILDGVNKCGLMYDCAHYSHIPPVFYSFNLSTMCFNSATLLKDSKLIVSYHFSIQRDFNTTIMLTFFFFFLLLLRVVTLRNWPFRTNQNLAQTWGLSETYLAQCRMRRMASMLVSGKDALQANSDRHLTASWKESMVAAKCFSNTFAAGRMEGKDDRGIMTDKKRREGKIKNRSDLCN